MDPLSEQSATDGLDSPIQAIARQLRDGDDVLGAWYAAAFPQVQRLCRGFLAQRGGADDVAQDAMLRIIDQIGRWDPSRPYLAWQRTLVLNLCRNHHRAESRRGLHEEAAGAERAVKRLPNPADEMERREVGELVGRFLAVLAPREREAFILVELEGMRPIDAAEAMGVQGSTVRAALTLARRRMREALAPFFEGDLS